MARDLAASLPAAQALFDQAADALGFDLLDVCAHGPADKLNTTDVSQPAIYVASLAALEHLKATDAAALDDVTATAGLSLGEYTALTFAGSLSFADGLTVVRARGRAMQAAAEATAGAMVSLLGVNPPEAELLVAQARGDGTLEVANLLCPGNTVVSGSTAAIDKVCDLAEDQKFKPIRLAVAGAFHTNLMKPADDQLAAALAAITLTPPRIPVWSNVDARPHTDPGEIKELLVRQVISPVRWEETMRGMLAAGVDKFCEIGPGRVLAGLLKRVDRKLAVRNVTA